MKGKIFKIFLIDGTARCVYAFVPRALFTFNLFLLGLLLVTVVSAQRPAERGGSHSGDNIRIACVGNSITYGGGLKDKANDSYPAVLQKKLGARYQVRNFGQNGATLLRRGPNPYVETEAFRNALAFNPDIVIIDLGINDTGLKVWPNFRDDFTADYIDLINQFRSLESRPEIWLCSMTPYFNQSKRFKTALRDWYWEVQENIRLVSESTQTGFIDLHTPLYTKPHLFSDAVHPDREGAAIIAETIYGVISGDYGGLSLAEIFGSRMVLQRNRPLPIWGKANAHQIVSVTFDNSTLETRADIGGNWSVAFPPFQEGGPFAISIQSGKEKIVLEDVLIGEVWICSGQSNMTFKLSEAATAAADVAGAMNSRIRLFDMKTADRTIREAWTPEVLERINDLVYEGGMWEVCTPNSAADFSAVAYYFGKKLYDELKVPIGLVHNSKGGSPAESWIDRRTLEFDPLLADIFHD